MRFFSIFVVSAALSHCTCFCPSRRRHSRFTTPWSSRQQDPSSSCQPSSTAMFGSADALLRMVEEVSAGQFNPEVVEKMSELEKALTSFLEEEKAAQDDKLSPRPPVIPPPLKSFIREEETREERDNSLMKAEKALEKLRMRLRQEEETLRKAEAALHQSMEEQEVLRRAEKALAKSRAAAEERKADAIRRTKEAVASAEKARKEKEEAERIAREHGIVGGVNGDFSTATARPTISLSSFEEDINGKATNGDSPSNVSSDAPPGMPILSDWIQYIDGSITGRVKGSRNFIDGSKVSTSPVAAGAKGGMVITTQSGSKYYLEKAPNQGSKTNPSSGTESVNGVSGSTPAAANGSVVSKSTGLNGSVSNAMSYKTNGSDSSNRKTTKAPPGVPSIVNWELLEDGGIAGLIYDSPNAANGDYVETSPIAKGSIESGYIVQTSSGSKYFLSPDQAEREENVLAAFKDLAAARRGGTITITKEMKQKQAEQAQEALGQLQNARTRSTFSLGDLFGAKDPSSTPPANGSIAPTGIPTLSRWSKNEDGTITGVVYGSAALSDGDLVTTSPIAKGEVKGSAMVTTVSGSVYYLE